MFRILFVVAIIAKIFMLRDAVRRGVPTHWLWIIAFLPLGEVLYFFVYPWDDPRFRKKRRAVTASFQRPDLAGKRRAHTAEPDVENTFALAQALYDRGLYQEAERRLELLTRHDDHDKEALYLLGMVRLELEAYAMAAQSFALLVSMSPGFRNHAARLQLAFAYYQGKREDACLETLADLCRDAPSLKHRVIHAEYLQKCRQPAAARAELARAGDLEGDEEWRARASRLAERLSAESANDGEER